jgi:membrane protein required for colicin V production
MPIYDVGMLIVLGIAIWFGYRKGLAWQIASLAAVIVSYIVAVNFREPVSQFIQAEAPWNRIGAMLILFLGTSLLIWTVYAQVNKSLKQAELKGFDRQMGALLGALKGAILCMVITMFAVSLMGDKAHQAVHTSTIGPYVEKGIWTLSDIVPAEIAKYVDPHVENYKNTTGHSEEDIHNGHNHGMMNGQVGNGTMYPAGGQFSQDPSQLPSSQTPYQGQVQWGQTANTNWGQTQSQPGTGQQGQTANNIWGQPQNGSNGSVPQTAQNQFSELDISEVSRQMLEQARQQGIQIGAEALREQAKKWLESQMNNQR